MLPFSRIKLYFLKEFNKWDLIKLFINTFIANAKRLPDSLGTLILLPNNRKSEVKSQGYKDSTFLLSSPNFFTMTDNYILKKYTFGIFILLSIVVINELITIKSVSRCQFSSKIMHQIDIRKQSI